MSKRIKYYNVYGKAVDSNGEVRYVTVVGRLEQTRERTIRQEMVPVELKPNNFTDGILTYHDKRLKRRLDLSMAICHPSDEFSEEEGVRVAKRRIKSGQLLGSLETSDVTMLTEDAIMAELIVKLNHIIENIENYLD